MSGSLPLCTTDFMAWNEIRTVGVEAMYAALPRPTITWDFYSTGIS